MITQKEFEEKVNKFKELEDIRGNIEKGFLKLIEEKMDFEAYIFIYSTWNYANFRYVLTKLKYEEFEKVIKEINPIFDKLKEEKFETVDFDYLRESISFIYDRLKKLVGQTCATKIMYFKNQNLFIMWDTKIRKLYGFKKTDAENYLNFLKLMKKEFSHIQWENKEISFARAIDKYNFTITQEKVRIKNEDQE